LAAFCNQSMEEKTKFAITMDNSKWTPNQFHGYSRMEGLKEQYMIRAMGKGISLPLPATYNYEGKQTDHFGQYALALYEHLDQLCRDVLYKVADAEDIDHSKVDKIIDPVSYNKRSETGSANISNPDACYTDYVYPGYISTSLLDVFHYHNYFDDRDQSEERFINNHSSHSDSGILTVVPCADEPGLDVFDQKFNKWIGIEKVVHKAATDHRLWATIFWGDSYEYLTKSAKPLLHRVNKCEGERYSIVFKMRTKPTVTAPRYQEDYVIADHQFRALDVVQQQVATQQLLTTAIFAIFTGAYFLAKKLGTPS